MKNITVSPGLTWLPTFDSIDVSKSPPGLLDSADTSSASGPTGAGGFNLGVNNGRVAGQIIFHLHLHVIPRHGGDGLRHWGAQEYREGEMERIADRIRNALAE